MSRAPRLLHFPAFRVAAGLIVLAGILGSVLAYRELRRTERAQAETEFYRHAAVLHTRLTDLLGRYDEALISLRTAFALEGGVTPAEFSRIAADLEERNPGVQAFEWIPVVPADRRAAVEAAMSAEAGRPITFTERVSAGRLGPAGERAEYLPIRYVHPHSGNESALGYDLTTGPSQAEIQRARATHQLAVTAQVRLVQEQGGQFGVIMIRPVYRALAGTPTSAGPAPEELVGFVQGVFRVRDMLETVRGRTWAPGSFLDVLFVDDSEPDPARRVLHYRPNDTQAPRDPVPTPQEFRAGLSQESPFAFGGRTWKILYRPDRAWTGDRLVLLPWVRTAGILTITSLLAGLVLLLGRRARDIERQVAERTAELAESRRQLSSLLHSLPGLAYRCQYDDQLKVIYVSVGVEALTGHPPEAFMSGRVHFRNLIHPDDVERVRAATREGLKTHHEIEVEYRLVTRDGTEKWVLSRGRGIYDDAGHPLFLEGLAIDITARKQAEAEKLGMERRLLESQKLESLGLLAGGIAHDFNNILTGILGNASLARLKLAEDSVILPNLRKIEVGSARAAELCQQMLSYSGHSSFQVEPVDVSQLVRETLPLLHVSLASRARLHLDLSTHPVVVLADATQIRQIVMNLVINAADAMGERAGDIHVTTGVRPVAAEFLREARDGESLAPGDYVFVEVKDNGCGMTPETMSRIFDPFFTTKFAGRGLGLAAVRGIVRGHQGALHVASRPGRGSTFTLLLPPTTRPLAPPAPATAEPRTYTGNVLVIDDEAPVREAAADLLKTFGFTVVTAKDGPEGIAQYALNPTGFVLVLLDLTMPNLSGEDTLTTLRAIAPDVRVLLISGYSESSRVARLAGVGPLRFLQKPFSRDDLARRIAELLP